MLQDREKLEDNLIEAIKSVNTDNKSVKKIRTGLVKYDINTGISQNLINFPENVKEIDLRLLCLLTEEVFKVTKDIDIDPKLFFTEIEIKESYKYSHQQSETLGFPLAFPNTTIVGNEAYLTSLSIKTIKKLLDNQLLKYNFENQREAKVVKRNDVITLSPTVNKHNIKEITEHLKNGTLVPTILVFNASVGTSSEDEELVYDSKKMELVINRDTDLEILDGYHRCVALNNALEMYPDLEFNFGVLITNYSLNKSKSYQAQIAKAHPISQTRVMELEAKRYSDTVVQQLREESDLKGRISQTSRTHTSADELVSYNILSNAIDEFFPMNTRKEALDVANYLTDFFNYLIGSYPDAFINNQTEYRKKTIFIDNNTFYGYVLLAKRMQEKGYKLNKLQKIIDSIDFSRDNKLWEELEVLNNRSIVNSNKARKGIIEYFKQLPI
jgi:hypothetical protein